MRTVYLFSLFLIKKKVNEDLSLQVEISCQKLQQLIDWKVEDIFTIQLINTLDITIN